VFRWLIGSSLKFRFLVLAIAAGLLVFGTEQLRKTPVDVFPEFAPPKVEIQTEGPGMTSTEVEELITIPMEDTMRGVPGDDFRVHPDGLRAAFAATRWGDPHHSQPRVLSLTQATDMGTIYSTGEIKDLAAIARERDLRVHIDGARVANAIAALDCSPAEMTWRSGVDVLSLGATKNGALSAEAIVVFDDDVADELVYRTKRSGHVTSKMRFQSAQLTAYLSGGLWLRLAENANRQMARLSAGLRDLGVGAANRADVNMLFAEVDDRVATELERADLLFYRIRPGVIRLERS